jgi:hypothetical protein
MFWLLLFAIIRLYVDLIRQLYYTCNVTWVGRCVLGEFSRECGVRCVGALGLECVVIMPFCSLIVCLCLGYSIIQGSLVYNAIQSGLLYIYILHIYRIIF